MCEELDLEGVRRWFYGGTPPLDVTDGPPDAADVADARGLAAAGRVLVDGRRGPAAAQAGAKSLGRSHAV